MKSPADSIMPLLRRDNSFAETCSFTGSHKWEQLSLGATPGSSVDLEWENEIGFNSSSNIGATEELQWMVLTENTNNSWRSSPISNSNGLEWDGDFTSVDISDLVAETQRLTVDVEQNIEQDTSTTTFRDIDNNS
ncbi:AP-1 complex-associated regulatory protein-like [Stegodyphus dumicola]|uniref:AP-1 complex-associated regulatory protein-like n=1 Tax=Stegodyphus dumicola TaxID=202533 RepID=UPI0015A7C759|nr:AP-1 complex-associated regulatory protein-like [Stegodyphus dumicola]